MTFKVEIGYRYYIFNNDIEAMEFAKYALLHAVTRENICITLIDEKEEKEEDD